MGWRRRDLEKKRIRAGNYVSIESRLLEKNITYVF